MNDEAQKELSKVEYWENRYAAEETPDNGSTEEYEWFKKYSSLKPFLDANLPGPETNPRVLHLGCGTSVCISQRAL